MECLTLTTTLRGNPFMAVKEPDGVKVIYCDNPTVKPVPLADFKADIQSMQEDADNQDFLTLIAFLECWQP